MKKEKQNISILLFSCIFLPLFAGCNEKKVLENTKGDVSIKATKKTLKSVLGSKAEPFKDGIKITSAFSKMPIYYSTTGGVYFRLDQKDEEKLSGKTVIVEITAGPIEENVLQQRNDDYPNNSHEFAVSYSTAAVGASGWKSFPVKLEKSKYRFKYKIKKDPKLGLRKHTDYIGIISDIKGESKPIIVYKVNVFIIK